MWNLGHIFNAIFSLFLSGSIFCEAVTLDKWGLKLKNMYYNYPLCIRFRGIMSKLQKYRFLTYIEVTNRKNSMTAERNTSVRRYIQNLGGVFARFFLLLWILLKMKQMYCCLEGFYAMYLSPRLSTENTRFVAKWKTK